MQAPRALVVARDLALAGEVGRALAGFGLTWSHARDGAGARRLLAVAHPRLIVVHLAARGGVRRWLDDLLVQPGRPGVLAAADPGDLDRLVRVLRDGADDYVVLPGAPADWIARAGPLLERGGAVSECDEPPGAGPDARHPADPVPNPSAPLAPASRGLPCCAATR